MNTSNSDSLDAQFPEFNEEIEIEKKLEELEKDIERVRGELLETVEEKGFCFSIAETNRISDKLDKLIVQFMRLKSNLE